MDTATMFAFILAGIWGAMWAAFLQRNYHGRFLAARMTWLTVVIGIGVDMAILILVIPFEMWIRVLAVIAASSIAIIARSLRNEADDTRTYLHLKDE